MRAVFADASFWIARARRGDQHAEAARQAEAALGEAALLTTEEVLVELLNALSEYGPVMRQAAVLMVQILVEDDRVTVIHQSEDSFRRGLELYQRRLDKGYSLTDCVSMCAMDSYGIRDILTTDDHFRQAGYNALMAETEDKRLHRSRPSTR